MGMETTGKLHTVFEIKQVSERFTKREFVIEFADNPKYPQTVMFQLTGDRCSLIDGIAIGDTVRVEFSLRGREWRSPSGEVKYFNTLDAWTIEAVGPRAAKTSSGAPPAAAAAPDDEIPFASCSPAHEPTPIARVLRGVG